MSFGTVLNTEKIELQKVSRQKVHFGKPKLRNILRMIQNSLTSENEIISK